MRDVICETVLCNIKYIIYAMLSTADQPEYHSIILNRYVYNLSSKLHNKICWLSCKTGWICLIFHLFHSFRLHLYMYPYYVNMLYYL